MNSNNLDHLISSYIDHFERINNDTNNENYKWCAIVDFQAAFDLSAADDAFADMLKKSRDATSNLIDTAFFRSGRIGKAGTGSDSASLKGSPCG